MTTPGSPLGSLSGKNRKRFDIPALALISLALLIIGQIQPVVTVDTLGPSRSTYTIPAGILQLVRGGNILLALIIFAFSMVFPFLKIFALGVIWFKKMEPEARSRSLRLLKVLGKWSMLDVFVVVVLTGSVQLGILAETTPESGVYIFGSAILLSLLTTFLMAHAAGAEGGEGASEGKPHRLQPHIKVLGVLAFGLFLAGLFVPVMHVEEWLFWKRDYSIISGTLELFKGGELFLGIVVAVFVIALPLASFAAFLALCLSSTSRLTWVRTLHKWSMLDVFGLALLIVIVKIGGLAKVQPQVGLWLFSAAALLTVYVSWKLDREAT